MRHGLFALLAVTLMACPKPPPPSPVPITPPDAVYPACPLDMGLPSIDDVCDGIATPQHDACVNCKGTVGGCIDMVDAVYCAKGGCLNDPVCRRDDEDKNTASKAKKKLKNRRK